MTCIIYDKLYRFGRGISLTLLVVAGCTTVPKTSKIGENRFQISVIDGFHGWGEWNQAAQVACPDGFKIIERQTTQGLPGYNIGTVECDANSTGGTRAVGNK